MRSVEDALREKKNGIELKEETAGIIIIDEPINGIFKYTEGETIILNKTEFTYKGKGEDGCYYFEWISRI